MSYCYRCDFCQKIMNRKGRAVITFPNLIGKEYDICFACVKKIGNKAEKAIELLQNEKAIRDISEIRI